jgi:hypothetical protein
LAGPICSLRARRRQSKRSCSVGARFSMSQR